MPFSLSRDSRGEIYACAISKLFYVFRVFELGLTHLDDDGDLRPDRGLVDAAHLAGLDLKDKGAVGGSGTLPVDQRLGVHDPRVRVDGKNVRWPGDDGVDNRVANAAVPVHGAYPKDLEETPVHRNVNAFLIESR